MAEIRTSYNGAIIDDATMDYLKTMNIIGKSYLISGSPQSAIKKLAEEIVSSTPDGLLLVTLEKQLELEPQCNAIRLWTDEQKGIKTLSEQIDTLHNLRSDRIFVGTINDYDSATTFLECTHLNPTGSTINAPDCKSALDKITDYIIEDGRFRRDLTYRTLIGNLHTIVHVQTYQQNDVTSVIVDEVIEINSKGDSYTVMKFEQTDVDDQNVPIGEFVFFGPSEVGS